jgi:hypothetical protein
LPQIANKFHDALHCRLIGDRSYQAGRLIELPLQALAIFIAVHLNLPFTLDGVACGLFKATFD